MRIEWSGRSRKVLAGAAVLACALPLVLAVVASAEDGVERHRWADDRPKGRDCDGEEAGHRKHGRWMAGDFHTHTFLTDGSHTQDDVLANAFGGSYDVAAGPTAAPGFGLDWMANSEHGGARNRNPLGLPWPAGTDFLGGPPAGNLWRWQSLWQYSYPIIEAARETYQDKLVVQGYEWNVPSHEHASVAIVGASEDGGRAIARHEYLFDASDTGTSSDAFLGVTGKTSANDHAKAIAGAAWLQANYPKTSYFLPNHPSRQLRYSAADLRAFNDVAPDVCFGLEGMPGHQKEPSRGGYGNNFYLADKKTLDAERTARARTYGGADSMVAKVGGLWDSLLGEGRHFWVFVNSDFHSAAADADFYPGEYAKSYTFVKDEDRDGETSYEELVDGLRSGDSFAVHGDLIDALEFSVKSRDRKAVMGETLSVRKGDSLTVTVRFRSPAFNNNGDAPRVDHVDLIAGEVGPRALPGTAEYLKDTNDTARVVATFDESDWEEDDGWLVIKHKIRGLDRPMYFRLRGANLAPTTPNETDAEGNPLSDDLVGANDAQKAYADLWFYSNPVFVAAE